jgi:hypothetical protein
MSTKQHPLKGTKMLKCNATKKKAENLKEKDKRCIKKRDHAYPRYRLDHYGI